MIFVLLYSIVHCYIFDTTRGILETKFIGSINCTGNPSYPVMYYHFDGWCESFTGDSWHYAIENNNRILMYYHYDSHCTSGISTPDYNYTNGYCKRQGLDSLLYTIGSIPLLNEHGFYERLYSDNSCLGLLHVKSYPNGKDQSTKCIDGFVNDQKDGDCSSIDGNRYECNEKPFTCNGYYSRQSCSGSGICYSNGSCVCFDDHFGTNCEMRLVYCNYIESRTPAVCSGYGKCIPNVENGISESMDGFCVCDNDHYGLNCDKNTIIQQQVDNTPLSIGIGYAGGVLTMIVLVCIALFSTIPFITIYICKRKEKQDNEKELEKQ